jgi:hypothetical protein
MLPRIARAENRESPADPLVRRTSPANSVFSFARVQGLSWSPAGHPARFCAARSPSRLPKILSIFNGLNGRSGGIRTHDP